ncbi:Formyl transferase [Seinonella peptonophila]|uniref:Formyl transferase n=1 Tax=Seinonella peptonophila TaxID=112248 RepID=A0A1M5AY78_9BACL|nr:formyltransferase family protein [Seinonella peptonophila]SHF35037.1 Formyl transferase [Seinonella peptonophila]
MKVFVYESKQLLGKLCLWYFRRNKIEVVSNRKKADVAFAPFPIRILSKQEIEKPKYGTLIFHPSLLPRHRGLDPIAWAFRFREKYTGACWYWATPEINQGDICEMEVLAIGPNDTPQTFWEHVAVPSAIRMLYFIIEDLSNGIQRRRPQNHDFATFEPYVTEPPGKEDFF